MTLSTVDRTTGGAGRDGAAAPFFTRAPVAAPMPAASPVPVDPPVHVETFATHASLTWRAAGLERFLEAVRATGSIPDDATPTVDATNAAGRRRLRLDEIDATSGVTTYVRVDPPAPWTLAWERRTDPTVSLTGTPDAGTCRALHVATTDCAEWTRSHRAALDRLLAAV
jgi:hypothetical protein